MLRHATTAIPILSRKKLVILSANGEKLTWKALELHKKNSMSSYRQALKDARTEHIRKLIDNNQNNPRFLFSTVARLTNKHMSPNLNTFTFTFMHLADAFIQSDLHCIQVTVSTVYQLLLSLGIEPMILALLAPCSTSWATGKLSPHKFLISHKETKGLWTLNTSYRTWVKFESYSIV